MRAFLVKFAGFALCIYDRQPGILTLTYARPGQKEKVRVVDDEDFEDCAGELDDEAFERSEPGLGASAEGLSMSLIKNDGVLKIGYEDNHGGVVDWTFRGLTRMMASASTQTVSEAQPKLSISTIQTITTNSTPERTIKPLRSELSGISTTDPNGEGAQYTSRPALHKLARSTHNSPSWPAHLYMACYRIQPVSQSEVGILHIDLEEGTVWYEAWHGEGHIIQQTYTRRQIDLRNAATSVSYFSYDRLLGEDLPTHQLRLSKINRAGSRVTFFAADCSAPGYQMWGSEVYKNIDPIPHYSALDWNKARGRQRPMITIPDLKAVKEKGRNALKRKLQVVEEEEEEEKKKKEYKKAKIEVCAAEGGTQDDLSSNCET